MSIGALGPAGAAALPSLSQRPTATATSTDGPDFGERIGGALRAVSDAQAEARSQAQAFETGAVTDLTGVMVAQEVSSLGFQLALNVRNKALGAYRDIMNMPV